MLGFFWGGVLLSVCVCVRMLVYLPEGLHCLCTRVPLDLLVIVPSNVDAVNESPDLFKSNKHSTISPTFFNFYCFEKLYHGAV